MSDFDIIDSKNGELTDAIHSVGLAYDEWLNKNGMEVDQRDINMVKAFIVSFVSHFKAEDDVTLTSEDRVVINNILADIPNNLTKDVVMKIEI